MNKDSNIKFYSLDNIKISKNEFNKVLDDLTKKDIKFLSNKIDRTIKQINEEFTKHNIALNLNRNYTLKSINELIKDIEDILSKIIIEKDSIKVGVFSTQKKLKKDKLKKYEKLIDFLTKNQNDIISVKDEYNKVISRKNVNEYFSIEEENIVKKDDNPLERTINFYTKKNN
ncbi:MAG: hypothetical protein IJ094_01760 [Bacilli bacterium]|nr:hypothetical protein [Bacilli bacterium]